jgi:nucleoside-diphosphate-sugar epimerase
MRRGGHVLVPGPDRSIQPIDVRDLSRFLLDQVERKEHGVFNLAAPTDRQTYGDMLRACVNVTSSVAERPVELVWVDEKWLVRNGVSQWTELPLWRDAAAPWSMSAVRAEAAGLLCRPIVETVVDTWVWLRNGGQPVSHERFAEHGISLEKEAQLMRKWRATRLHS